MTFALEDAAAYFETGDAGFATTATLAAASVTGIFSASTIDSETGAVNTREQSFTLPAADAPSAAPGQAFVHAAVNYTVRRVDLLPPDAAICRLVLARTA